MKKVGGILFPWIVASLIGVSSVITAFAAKKSEFRMVETYPKLAVEIVGKYPTKMKLLSNGIVLVQTDAIELFAQELHKKTGRCGGFIDVTDETDWAKNWKRQRRQAPVQLPQLGTKKENVVRALQEVRPLNIENFVKLYSGQFKTRSARSKDGARPPIWLHDYWTQMALTAGRSDIKVDLYAPPSGYEQANVRITIPGENPSLPIVVMGGHLDSINVHGGDAAPGADDDASGISALTETYRVLLATNFRPKATLQIFGYAAEELGLLGSRAIAEKYRQANSNIRGVLQLDMVAWPGESKTVTFIMDYVNKELTLWTAQLYGLYVGNNIKQDRCGYACSDHASWDRYGYPAVMPFESPMNEMNERIHSTKDLWDQFLNAEYAAQFTKLAVAFAIELTESN